MKHLNSDAPLVTVGQVAAKQALLESKVAQRDDLSAEIEKLEKWLAAAALVAGDDVMTHTVTQVEEDELWDGAVEEENMADATKRILGMFQKGIAHPQLQSELRKIPRFAERLDKNPNYYYTMVSRLIKRGEVVKFRKALRLPKAEAETETAELL